MEPKDEIKTRLDVVDIVSGYLQLKPSGSGSFKAVCPFHAEKSPSFHVSRDKQIWHCFGCSKGGDLISFVMEIEGMDFFDALQLLGKRAGVEVVKTYKKGNGEREISYELHELAGKFYETVLWQHDTASAARKYVFDRGMDKELVKKFGIGYAPEKWDALVSFLLNKGFNAKQIETAGLGIRRRNGSGLIDRFRHRIMIPLCDSAGRIVGFTGRALPSAEDQGPKYLNSPETPIYHKSKILFGLHLAKHGIRAKKRVIVVEGNLDVVASHKADVPEVVASSGTALTELQLDQLKRITNKIDFSFDADEAGFAAAKRGIRLAQAKGFEVGVIAIPAEAGKDPDDVVQKDPAAWKAIAEKPVHIMEYYFEKALSGFDYTDVNAKREMAHFLLKEIACIESAIDREHWLQRLSDTISVEISVLRGLLKQDQEKDENGPPIAEKAPAEVAFAPKPPVITSRLEQATSFLLGLAISNPELAETLFARIEPDSLPEKPWGAIYKHLVLLYTTEYSSGTPQKQNYSALRDRLKELFPEDVQRIDASVLRVEQMIDGMPNNKVREEMTRHMSILTTASKDAKKKQLEAAIRQAEQQGDSERLRALMTEYSKLI